jgi:hypothetical protein
MCIATATIFDKLTCLKVLYASYILKVLTLSYLHLYYMIIYVSFTFIYTSRKITQLMSFLHNDTYTQIYRITSRTLYKVAQQMNDLSKNECMPRAIRKQQALFFSFSFFHTNPHVIFVFRALLFSVLSCSLSLCLSSFSVKVKSCFCFACVRACARVCMVLSIVDGETFKNIRCCCSLAFSSANVPARIVLFSLFFQCTHN